MTTTATPTTVTTPAMQGGTLDVVNWFRQNHIRVENMLGKKLSAMSLQYTQADGYSMTYTEAEADPVASPQVVATVE